MIRIPIVGLLSANGQFKSDMEFLLPVSASNWETIRIVSKSVRTLPIAETDASRLEQAHAEELKVPSERGLR